MKIYETFLRICARAVRNGDGHAAIMPLLCRCGYLTLQGPNRFTIADHVREQDQVIICAFCIGTLRFFVLARGQKIYYSEEHPP